MWQFLCDRWQAAQLRARYQRLAQERVLHLLEESRPEPADDDPGRWLLLGNSKSTPDEPRRAELRTRARLLVHANPYARNLLRLLEVYVAGPGLILNAVGHRPSVEASLLRHCNRLWTQFLQANRRHFSFRETARRTWRDGECFVRFYPQPQWPPTVRYIDPEEIGPTSDGAADNQGVLTDAHDVETAVAYQRIDPATGTPIEVIPAEELLHLKVGVDSNEPRGLTIFAPVLESLSAFDKWLEIELQARKLQASIVLWRKVQGSPAQTAALADAVSTGSASDAGGSVRRERYRPGTILTTSHHTDLEFLSPQTNFGDAVPLGRLMLLGIAAGAGVPEFMLTADASNASYSSTMVAEGAAVKLFESEQRFLAEELEPLWRWVMAEGAREGLLPDDVLDHMQPQWSFPSLVNRDRAKDRETDATLIQAGVLSRAEVSRRDGVDPDTMRAELAAEAVASPHR